MFPFDQPVFHALNGAVGQSTRLFETALLFCGQLPLILVVATMLCLWWTGADGRPHGAKWSIGRRAVQPAGRRLSRQRCVAVACAVALAFVSTRLLAFAFEYQRPLAVTDVLAPIDPDRWGYIRHAMTGFGAFPSDHAALFFAVATGLFAWSRRLGAAGLVAASLLCTARVAVGFHFPSDMIAGGMIGAAYATGAVLLARRSPGQFDVIARLFDDYPAILYPALFVVAIDFTQHFRVVFKGIFSLLFMLVGAGD